MGEGEGSSTSVTNVSLDCNTLRYTPSTDCYSVILYVVVSYDNNMYLYAYAHVIRCLIIIRFRLAVAATLIIPKQRIFNSRPGNCNNGCVPYPESRLTDRNYGRARIILHPPYCACLYID